jgi:hypothetical protein
MPMRHGAKLTKSYSKAPRKPKLRSIKKRKAAPRQCLASLSSWRRQGPVGLTPGGHRREHLFASNRRHPERLSQRDPFRLSRFGKASRVSLVFNTHFTDTMDHWGPATTDGSAKDGEVILFNDSGISSNRQVSYSLEESAKRVLPSFLRQSASQLASTEDRP